VTIIEHGKAGCHDDFIALNQYPMGMKKEKLPV
jgi:hypothetical protein